ncbi:MAG: glycosyltransferase family 2 protein [Sulfolobales archaeon]
MSLEMVLLSTYLGFSALIWVAIYSASRERGSYEKPSRTSGEKNSVQHRVSILIPLYMEKPGSIMRTVSSIARQRYSKDLYDVWLIVEEEDQETLRGAEKALEFLRSRGVDARIYVVKGGRSSKARALNQVIDRVSGSIIAVYDADDSFDENQLEEAVRLMSSRGYDALGVRVYRYGEGVLGKMIYIDTVIWFDLVINALRKAGFHVPLSGEGLYIKKEVLMRLGGFPEKLAEDAYLSLILFEKGYRIGLLDSYVEEAAPLDITSHIRQRIRWYRGHLECLARILIYGGRRRLKASIGYLGPIVAVTSLVLSVITILMTMSYIARGSTHDSGSSANNGITITLAPYGSMLVVLFIEGLLPLLVIMLAVANNKGPRRGIDLAVHALAIPLYWILMSVAAVLAIFMRRVDWYKTRRASDHVIQGSELYSI